MQRLSIASLALLLLASCGREASREAEANLARALEAEAEAVALAEEVAANAVKMATDLAAVLDLEQALRDELWMLTGRLSTGEELIEHAENMLLRVAEREDLLMQGTDGMRIWVDARGRAAALLADPRADRERKALVIAEETLSRAKQHADEDPSDRLRMGLFGDAQAGKARVLKSLGRYLEAGDLFVEAVLVLEQSDKGRGSGTGSSEHRGEASGGGKGRGKGKGKNKVRSLALNRHTARLCGEAAEAYRLGGNLDKEFEHLGRERHFRAKVCQVEANAPGYRWQLARLELSKVIDRVADNETRRGRTQFGLDIELLVLRILREIWEEIPEEPLFYEGILPQQVEVATKAADWGAQGLEFLRTNLTQAFDDLQVIHKMGMPDEEAAAFEAKLCLQMGRGLANAASEEDTSETDATALRAEAANWFGRAVVTLDGLRGEDGTLPVQLAAVEEIALVGIDAIQTGG